MKKRLRIYAVSSVGRPGQTVRIEFVVDQLKEAGFEVISCLDRPLYRDNRDWREDVEGAKAEFEKLKQFFAENQFDIVVADLSAASDGRTNEQILAEGYGLPIYGFAPVQVTTPTRLFHVDKVFPTIPDLVKALMDLEYENQIAAEGEAEEKRQEERKLRNPLYRLWGEDWKSPLLVSMFGLLLLLVGSLIASPGIIFVGILCLIFMIAVAVQTQRFR